ncbi:hypothetical protein OTB20_22970 [Streptomyces sp. H27-H1]|uniref:hypothetical protein n=1 Tax=Streptomyces sp. H27-H1 TaxID=2996461 RepID=UPI00226E02BE|nr:hypothetical protein [Streptomyces sp. H27-H1]MCY0929016.1 hypothetical protein [Streptomyces sp. H27-H1]
MPGTQGADAVRDDLATMFCKRVAMKTKKGKTELEEIRLAEREIVEALIGNYRTVLKHIDAGGPAQYSRSGPGSFVILPISTPW